MWRSGFGPSGGGGGVEVSGIAGREVSQNTITWESHRQTSADETTKSVIRFVILNQQSIQFGVTRCGSIK